MRGRRRTSPTRAAQRQSARTSTGSLGGVDNWVQSSSGYPPMPPVPAPQFSADLHTPRQSGENLAYYPPPRALPAPGGAGGADSGRGDPAAPAPGAVPYGGIPGGRAGGRRNTASRPVSSYEMPGGYGASNRDSQPVIHYDDRHRDYSPERGHALVPAGGRETTYNMGYHEQPPSMGYPGGYPSVGEPMRGVNYVQPPLRSGASPDTGAGYPYAYPPPPVGYAPETPYEVEDEYYSPSGPAPKVGSRKTRRHSPPRDAGPRASAHSVPMPPTGDIPGYGGYDAYDVVEPPEADYYAPHHAGARPGAHRIQSSIDLPSHAHPSNALARTRSTNAGPDPTRGRRADSDGGYSLPHDRLDRGERVESRGRIDRGERIERGERYERGGLDRGIDRGERPRHGVERGYERDREYGSDRGMDRYERGRDWERERIEREKQKEMERQREEELKKEKEALAQREKELADREMRIKERELEEARKAQEEKERLERLEKERKEQEEKERLEKERLEKEKKEQEEKERLEREEKERKEKEEKERQEKERQEKEQKERELAAQYGYGALGYFGRNPGTPAAPTPPVPGAFPPPAGTPTMAITPYQLPVPPPGAPPMPITIQPVIPPHAAAAPPDMGHPSQPPSFAPYPQGPPMRQHEMEVDSGIHLDPDHERSYTDHYMRNRDAFAVADNLGRMSIDDLPFEPQGGRGGRRADYGGMRGGPGPRGGRGGMGMEVGYPRGGGNRFSQYGEMPDDRDFHDDGYGRPPPRGRDLAPYAPPAPGPPGGPVPFAFRPTSRPMKRERGRTIVLRDKVARRALEDLKYQFEEGDNRDELIVLNKLSEKELKHLEDVTDWMRSGMRGPPPLAPGSPPPDDRMLRGPPPGAPGSDRGSARGGDPRGDPRDPRGYSMKAPPIPRGGRPEQHSPEPASPPPPPPQQREATPPQPVKKPRVIAGGLVEDPENPGTYLNYRRNPKVVQG